VSFRLLRHVGAAMAGKPARARHRSGHMMLESAQRVIRRDRCGAACSRRRNAYDRANHNEKTAERTMTKIAFEDFERQVVQHHLIKGNVYENGAALVERANRWIEENGVDVMNVESLSTFGAGDDTSVSHWYSGIRVWYRVAG
jgi:hypothetical protein